MSSTTVAEFANELKKSTETLLEQLRSAGVSKSGPTDSLTDADKQKLLGHLQASHGTATRSPSFTRVTPAPALSTMPTPSCPGMNGGDGLTGQSPCAAWMSVWHKPEASMRTSTCPAPGEGVGTFSYASGLSNP